MKTYILSENYIQKMNKRAKLKSWISVAFPMCIFAFVLIQESLDSFNSQLTISFLGIILVLSILGLIISRLTSKKVEKHNRSFKIILTDEVIIKRELNQQEIIIRYEDIKIINETSKHLYIYSNHGFVYILIPVGLDNYNELIEFLDKNYGYKFKNRKIRESVI